jgi:hypothetical protein
MVKGDKSTERRRNGIRGVRTEEDKKKENK